MRQLSIFNWAQQEGEAKTLVVENVQVKQEEEDDTEDDTDTL